MTTETHDINEAVAPDTSATQSVPARRKTWREERWERRRRRRAFEEVLAWFLVPIIVLSAYWAVYGGLAALGTSPGALIDGVQSILANH